MRGVPSALLAAVLAAGAWAAAPEGLPAVSTESLLAAAVQLYRDGKLPEAFEGMISVLDRDPENITAKNFVWTIARKMRDRERRATLKNDEKEEAVRQAYALLSERRRLSKEALEKLRVVYERTRNVRGPEELKLSAEGMDRFLGTEFQDERERAQAESYFQKIMANLSRALAKSAFVSRKDHMNAQATLAYYKGDWPGAVEKWTAALKEDPSDKNIKKNVQNLEVLIRRKEWESKIRDLTAQAETYQRTGYMREAARFWTQVLRLNKKDARALENLALCRKAYTKEEKAAQVKDLTGKGVELYQAGKASDAVDMWLKALQIDPGYDQARVWISHVGKKLEVARESAPDPSPVPAAKRAFAKPVGATPAPAAPRPAELTRAQEYYRQGLLLYAGNELSKAITAWKEALRLAPNLVQAQQALRQAQAEIKYLE